MWDEEIARLPKARQQDAQIAVILGWEMLWSNGQNLMAYAPSEIAAAGIEAERMPVPEFTRMLAEYEVLREIAQSARILAVGHAREPYYEAEWARLDAALKAVEARTDVGKDAGTGA
jgi:hypothetical protein